MQLWLAAHDAADLAAVAAPYFSHLPPALLLSGLQRYATAGIWSRTPEISRPGFARLAQSMQSGGLVRGLARYEDCVAAIAG
jgi:NitT/TauT family transport system substrate-binding protein